MSYLFKPSIYNNDTKQQLWMSIFADSHDSICSCETPFAHALSCMFPEGHRDRQLTVEQIITRDTALCHSGGTAEENLDLVNTEPTETGATNLRQEEPDEDSLGDVEVEELIAAADDAIIR